MNSIEIEVSTGAKLEVFYSVDPGQRGSYEVEEIPPHIQFITKVLSHTDCQSGLIVNCDFATLRAIGILNEIETTLDELLSEGKIS